MKTRYYLISIFMVLVFSLAITVPGALAKSKSKDIQALFDGDEAFAQIEALVSFGPRVTGTPAEQAAAAYIADEMESYGLDVEIQEFDILYFEELSPPVLKQVSPNSHGLSGRYRFCDHGLLRQWGRDGQLAGS